MRLLVAPHDLGIGGSQINAIDLAAEAAKAGHHVVVYGKTGALVDYIESRGLEFIPARNLRYRPAPSRIAQLAKLARSRRLDLIHAYEWPPCLDAYFGAHRIGGVPLLCTVMSMAVSPFVPSSIPLMLGTEALAAEAARRHRAPVWVLEPPIDTVADSPSIEGSQVRHALGIADDSLLMVTASRLALELKLDALVDAIDATNDVAGEFPVALLIVGDGPASAALRARADYVNRRWGRDVIRFSGALADPRAAYAAADIVLGMGSSSLRAMAISKPVIVQGERGFSRVFEQSSLAYFLRHGFWGIGDGQPNSRRLSDQMRELLADDERRAELARYGRQTVIDRFSLERGARLQLEVYDAVLARQFVRQPLEAAVAAGRAFRLELQNHDPREKRQRSASEAAQVGRSRGSASIASSRSRTDRMSLVAPTHDRRFGAHRSRIAGEWDGLVVLCAANGWDEVKLADRHMAEHLCALAPVLYVDPPISHLTRINAPLVASSLKRPRLRRIGPKIARYTPVALPKPMAPAMLPLTNRIVRHQLKAAVRRLDARVEAVISTWLFVDSYGVCGERVRAYWWQDDPVAAAALWGRSAARLADGDRRLCASSDLVLAVSEAVVEDLRERGVEASYLPNGCDATFYRGVDRATDPSDVHLPGPIAGFIGHLNSRTDLSLLEAIADAGASLLLIGPHDPALEPTRFATLVARANVAHLGQRPFEDLLPYLKAIDVGIVPYANTQFNRNSFPMKTLEYLAAGRPVVATPLPAVRSLNTDLVTLAKTPHDFAAAVMREAPKSRLPSLVAERRSFAALNSWDARANQLAGLLGLGP